jgi:hypothetical protein
MFIVDVNRFQSPMVRPLGGHYKLGQRFASKIGGNADEIRQWSGYAGDPFGAAAIHRELD